MSIDLIASKPKLYSTVLDIIRLANIIKTETFDFTGAGDDYNNEIIWDNEIEAYIINAGSIIDGYLKQQYGAPTGLVIDAWAKTPIADRKNNSKKSKLLGVEILKTDSSSAFWIVEFTSKTQFKLTSSLENAQGTGSISADASSNNGEVKIGDNSWKDSSNISTKDKFYFEILNIYPLINTISSLLATSLVLSEKYTEALPNEAIYPQRLWKRGMELLKDLIDEDNSLALESDAGIIEGETISIAYQINTLGQDKSEYLIENFIDY